MTTLLCTEDCEEEEYIDMDVNCLDPDFPFRSSTSSAQSREFEFQMSSSRNDKESAAVPAATFPADELFYRGKLLPLHLPPRLKMVQHLLSGDATIPFISTAPCTNNTTPLDSCNISPSESCRASCELNPGDYFFEWSSELSTSIENRSRKKTWAKKIKHSILGQINLKAYLKSLFTKPDQSCPKLDMKCSKFDEISKKTPFGKASSHPRIADVMQNMGDKELDKNNINAQRRSFSGAIKRRSPTKCLSSSSSNSSSTSLNSGSFLELQLVRSSSVAEIECSIEAAIAHCKKSQKSAIVLGESGMFSLSAALKIAD